ncbi:SMC-Scp complex subunit ScpB [bacterium]|nr:SMC-Scp complex subunit ScpB [bacterium]
MSESWQIIEALLFASPEVVSSDRLAKAADLTPSEVKACIEKLRRDYNDTGRAFHIREVAGGWQMSTLPRFSPWVARLLQKRGRDRLSKAALETLAVIAHRQPINKPDIDQTRGIDSSYIISNLLERGLIKIKGRDKRAGHPFVYGTTPRFLEYFGLNSLNDLPDLEEPSVKEEDIMPLEESGEEKELAQNELLQEDKNEESPEPVDPEALRAIGYRIDTGDATQREPEKTREGDDDA